MKKITIILIYISFFANIANSQIFSFEMYKNIKEYYNLIGIDIKATSKKGIEETIKIRELVKGLNSNQISLYDFCSAENDTFFDIIIVENDSVQVWSILAINPLLRRVVDISKKYSDVSNNRKDIQWIDEILDLHRQALNRSIFNCCLTEHKRGKYTYNIMLHSLKKPDISNP